MWLTGPAASNQDSVHAIGSRMPVVLGSMAVITLVLLFLMTGSIILPIKAVLMNALSLSAASGALMWVFQEGHLGGLGTAATGTLGVQLPVLLFCIAFGLSMDYEGAKALSSPDRLDANERTGTGTGTGTDWKELRWAAGRLILGTFRTAGEGRRVICG